jgi:N-acetylglucosamine kinase-like BadF-type ATPase
VQQRLFLGVDIGATKCHALIANEFGQTLGFGEAGPGNHEVVGYPGLIEALHKCTDDALNMAGVSTSSISAAGFGIAGYDWPGELEPTLDAVSHLGLSAQIEVVNDTIIGLVAGAEKGWGIGLVSGTGCNCWGWNENHEIGRVSGNGGWFGEYAGGGDIVQKAVTAVAYEAFQRGPATQLTPIFLKLTGAQNAFDLLEGLTLTRYEIDSRAAPLVIQAARQGDQVALSIIQWAGDELGELANCVIRQIGLEQKEFDVVLIGSIFNSGELLLASLRSKIIQIAPTARFVRLSTPPVVGGVLIAMQKSSAYTSGARVKLVNSVKKFFTDTNKLA